MMPELREILIELSRASVLLVASDFDGTLSPIAPHPDKAIPNRASFTALHALADLPATHVAIISGRALSDLAHRSGVSDRIHLVGSHGSEFDPDFVHSITREQQARRNHIRTALHALANQDARLLIEDKPAGVALHYRQMDSDSFRVVVESVLLQLADTEGIHVKKGTKVVDFSVVPTDKGVALKTLRRRFAATACIFLGDDLSDEDAFATLAGPDVGVKVGEGPTCAAFRVANPVEAAQVLAFLSEHRAKWLAGQYSVPIEKHALLSDQRTVALVTPTARIVWMCLPRIDSPAVFAELLGGPTAGYFSIESADGAKPVGQTYRDQTFILETQWATFSVIDYLDCSAGRPFQRASRSDLIRVIEGTGDLVLEFAPRLDFGRQPTRIRSIPQGLCVEGALDPLVLRSPDIEWKVVSDGRHDRAWAHLRLDRGSLALELRYGLSTSNELSVPEVKRREMTDKFWTAWTFPLRIPLLHAELVRRSALVLKALCYGPSGAISAAATTSLPEEFGGVRNWDYRFCWLRDSALAAIALVKLGNTGHGIRLLDWLLGILDREGVHEALRPVYTVTGGHLPTEAVIAELPGYGGSRPVRVGNAAAQQLQLDVFGPIIELISLLAEAGAALSSEHWRLTDAILGTVEQRWREPDHGIWEVRGAPRHFVHSKIMCWLAVDRALSIARAFAGHQPDRWVALREEIAADVLSKGWNHALGSFAATYGGHELDAAVLHVGLSGLLDRNDERWTQTVQAVEKELRVGPTVFRYHFEDGLPGREGGFGLCTSWLIESLVRVGRIQEAKELLDGFVSTFGPTGLASEEYCPKANQCLGNHPQVYTHLGLINAVMAVSGA